MGTKKTVPVVLVRPYLITSKYLCNRITLQQFLQLLVLQQLVPQQQEPQAFRRQERSVLTYPQPQERGQPA
jgi:hypothetical protein